MKLVWPFESSMGKGGVSTQGRAPAWPSASRLAGRASRTPAVPNRGDMVVARHCGAGARLRRDARMGRVGPRVAGGVWKTDRGGHAHGRGCGESNGQSDRCHPSHVSTVLPRQRRLDGDAARPIEPLLYARRNRTRESDAALLARPNNLVDLEL